MAPSTPAQSPSPSAPSPTTTSASIAAAATTTTSKPSINSSNTRNLPPSPSSSSAAFDVAMQVRRNAEEYRQLAGPGPGGLGDWLKEIKKKDRQTAAMKPIKAQTLPPVRGTTTTLASLSASIAPPTAPPTASRLRSDDYRAWDKFDVDKALDELEKETDEISHNDQPTDPGIISEINQNDHEEEAEVLEKSLIEKEKGNAFFKKQDYKKAIHFYTKAITLLSPPTTSSPSTSTPPITHDPSNPLIVPLINRALAYIKLERWVEAEVDCTRALAMEGGGGGGNAGGKNVKALVRRGIARRELKRYDEALKDLQLAATLEPTNKTVKDELALVQDIFRPKKSPPSTATSSNASSTESLVDKQQLQFSSTNTAPLLMTARETKKLVHSNSSVTGTAQQQTTIIPPKRRRVPIREVGGVGGSGIETVVENVAATMDTSITTAAETVKTSSTSSPASVTELTQTKKKKLAIEEIGGDEGGQEVKEKKRKDIPSTVTAAASTVTSALAKPSSTTAAPNAKTSPSSLSSSSSSVPPPPTTMFEFERAWKGMKKDNNRLFEFLKSIDAEAYQKIFINSLESNYLVTILHIISTHFLSNTVDNLKSSSTITSSPVSSSNPHQSLMFQAVDILDALSRVQRFDMALMFLSKSDWAVVEMVKEGLMKSVDAGGGQAWEERVNIVMKKYAKK